MQVIDRADTKQYHEVPEQTGAVCCRSFAEMQIARADRPCAGRQDGIKAPAEHSLAHFAVVRRGAAGSVNGQREWGLDDHESNIAHRGRPPGFFDAATRVVG